MEAPSLPGPTCIGAERLNAVACGDDAEGAKQQRNHRQAEQQVDQRAPVVAKSAPDSHKVGQHPPAGEQSLSS